MKQDEESLFVTAALNRGKVVQLRHSGREWLGLSDFLDRCHLLGATATLATAYLQRAIAVSAASATPEINLGDMAVALGFAGKRFSITDPKHPLHMSLIRLVKFRVLTVTVSAEGGLTILDLNPGAVAARPDLLASKIAKEIARVGA